MVNPLNFLRSSRKKDNASEQDAPAEAPVQESADDAPAVAPEAEPAPVPTADPPAAPAPQAPASAAETPPAPAAPHGTPQGQPETPVAPLATPQPSQPRAGDLVDQDAPLRAEVEAAARTIYAEALQAVGRFFRAGRDAGDDLSKLPIAEIEAVASKLVGGMEDEHVGDALAAQAVGRYPDEGRFIVPHSVNVAVLSQRVGRQLGLEDQELLTLAVAALVHDVGTVRIPKDTFYKADSLTNEEWELMRQRPALSCEIIAGIGAPYRAVAEIAHQVHERLDGNGYPRALRVDSIALEASILGAVDIFEAFIHPRPYKKTVPAAAMYGVDNLMRMSHQFGDGVLKALVRSVGLFPVGTFVRMNSGEIARVLRGRSANPMRPEVEVVLDTQKRRLSQPRYIDLMATPHLYVFKPLSPEELAEFGL